MNKKTPIDIVCPHCSAGPGEACVTYSGKRRNKANTHINRSILFYTPEEPLLTIQKKYHCPSGHEYTKSNTSNTSRGRRCKSCSKDKRNGSKML